VGAFAEAARGVVAPSESARREADERQARLTKPAGSLGRIEVLGAQLSAIAGACPPPNPAPGAVAVFAGDHGVLAQGVSPWPQEVTAQMVVNFCRGGAAVNVLARVVGASVTVVDVGVATALPEDDLPGLRRARVAPGTADLSTGPAMTPEQVEAALDVGATVAEELVDQGARALVAGEMGIGNTTPAAALIAAFAGRPAAEVTGPGTGVDEATLERKRAIVAAAVARLSGSDPDARRVLAEVGGLEIAAMAGFMVGGAARRVPVVVDGVIAVAAALAAVALVPAALGYLVAGHRSTEPGAGVGLAHLGLDPLLDLSLRLGEGTGGCLALPLLEAGARVLGEMATFDDLGLA
jgi:nicotinate-nucleotide--dimethylbenzimidazole phosphoribosyltransferase